MIDRDISLPLLIQEELTQADIKNDNSYIIETKSLNNFISIEINKTGREILELCDGTHTVNDIINTFQKKYPNVDEERIVEDVDAFIHHMWLRHIVKFCGYNYLNDLCGYRYNYNNYCFEYLNSDDSFELDSKDVNDKDYVNPYFVNQNYDEFITSWVRKERSWFSIKKDKTTIYMSVVPQYELNIFTIEKILMYCDSFLEENVLQAFFSYVTTIYEDLFTKKFDSSENFCVLIYFWEQLKDHNNSFAYKGVLKKEISNKDVYVYCFEYDRRVRNG